MGRPGRNDLGAPRRSVGGRGLSHRYLIRFRGRRGRDLLLVLGAGSETSGIVPRSRLRYRRLKKLGPGFGIRVAKSSAASIRKPVASDCEGAGQVRELASDSHVRGLQRETHIVVRVRN